MNPTTQEVLITIIQQASEKENRQFSTIIVSDLKYKELSVKVILGVEVINKTEADKTFDLSNNWINDESIFLF